VATSEKVIDAPAERVFEAICLHWVDGSDGTSVLETDPNCRLALEVTDRPLGVARLDVELIPQNGGTCVRMVEHPTGGLLKPLNNRLFEMATHLRNERALDRLARLVERGIAHTPR
jgi:uncharacterized protein YndB with AHSA1/START domain